MNKPIVFVGDRPSSKNISEHVAFHGTQSGKTLTKWLQHMNINDYKLVNSHNSVELGHILHYYVHGHMFVALGNKASTILKKLSITHFSLPHPSPRNRKLNNKVFVDRVLNMCKNYILEKL